MIKIERLYPNEQTNNNYLNVNILFEKHSLIKYFGYQIIELK